MEREKETKLEHKAAQNVYGYIGLIPARAKAVVAAER